jgi:hypothetical protein
MGASATTGQASFTESARTLDIVVSKTSRSAFPKLRRQEVAQALLESLASIGVLDLRLFSFTT